MTPAKVQPRYTGHETFVCRYAWIPKVVRAVEKNPAFFKNEDLAMVELGVGKNMVRSAKFWADSVGVIEEVPGGWAVTEFGHLMFGHEGYDEFLQRPETLWLIHWKLSTNPRRPLFHWVQLLNHWQRSEFTESEALKFLKHELRDDDAVKSDRTLSDGIRVFINSYVPTRGRKGEIAEDNLDSPLTELGLLRKIGDRRDGDKSLEAVYGFVIGPKPGITAELFAYCVWEYWRNSPFADQETLGFRFVASMEGGPGQIFKLPELHVRPLLEALSNSTHGALTFDESSSMQQVTRHEDLSEEDLLKLIYADLVS